MPILLRRDERTKRVRGCVRTLDRNLLRSLQHTPPHHNTIQHNTTTPHHHHSRSALSSFSPLPTFFTHTKENNRLPFDTKFFASLHDYRLRSKIGKIQLMIGKNIKHTVTALNKRKTESNQTINCQKGFAEVDKNQPIRRNTQKQRLQNSARVPRDANFPVSLGFNRRKLDLLCTT